jgi:hypothetical protein
MAATGRPDTQSIEHCALWNRISEEDRLVNEHILKLHYCLIFFVLSNQTRSSQSSSAGL